MAWTAAAGASGPGYSGGFTAYAVVSDSEPGLEGSGLKAKCGNRGQRTRLQWRLRRLRRGFVFGSFVAVGR